MKTKASLDYSAPNEGESWLAMVRLAISSIVGMSWLRGSTCCPRGVLIFESSGKERV
jgi:hypothetical protein